MTIIETKNNEKRKLGNGMIIFLSIFILPGLLFGLFSTYQTIDIQKWQKVEATIDTTFYKYKSYRKRSSGKTPSRKKTITVCQVRAGYSYTWEGKSYQSSEIALWQKSYAETYPITSEIKKFLDNTKKVTAYVNPENPSEAVLVRSIHNGILFFYVSALSCFLAFGAISGLAFKIPSFRFGIICLISIAVLYLWYFILGGIDLTNCIEVIS